MISKKPETEGKVTFGFEAFTGYMGQFAGKSYILFN